MVFRPISHCSTSSMSSRKGIKISSKFKREIDDLYGNEIWKQEEKKISNNNGRRNE